MNREIHQSHSNGGYPVSVSSSGEGIHCTQWSAIEFVAQDFKVPRFRWAYDCRSKFDPCISADEDGYDVYFSWDTGDPEYFCHAHIDHLWKMEGGLNVQIPEADWAMARNVTPILTSANWVEPQTGRRYMCHDT